MRETSGGPFDLIMLIGNSLSMLPTHDDVRQALAAISRQLEPRGMAFVHAVNYHPLEIGQPKHKVARKELPDGEAVVVKNMIPTGRDGAVLVAFGYFVRRSARWTVWGSESTLLNLSERFLVDAASRAGLSVEGEYGDYDRSAFNMEISPDLLLLLRKP